MARHVECTPPDVEFHNGGLITQVRTYELMTPLFGGGVDPQHADPVTVIRGTEVRGQLRFWWRATRGGQVDFNENLNQIKAAEEKIWGAQRAR